MKNTGRLPASFRDPSGYIFKQNGLLYRQVNRGYEENYNCLMDSGLYQQLVERELLISHVEVSLDLAQADDAYKVLQPRFIPFVSYPYEWSFSQLKLAALTTLKVQKIALEFGMSLKDSSAYNIQFLEGKPILIDTLSFERYQKNKPWTPYRQFCQHFLGPLALAAYKDIRLNQLLRIFIDGIPLDLVARLLPLRSYLSLTLLIHIHLHARSQHYFKPSAKEKQGMGQNALLGFLDNLESGVKRLDWNAQKTAWANYYLDDSYTPEGVKHKQQLVADFIKLTAPGTVWDLGANSGLFSRITSHQGISTIAWDSDPGAVELNFRQVVKEGDPNLLPLLLDLTNPSAAIGWNNQERMSLVERGPVDLILVLALIHHLAIANNTPIDSIAKFLASLCNWLIIEFVPKEDPKVQLMMSAREDIFPDYTQSGFEAAFSCYFMIQQNEPIRDSRRILYLMRSRDEL